MNKLTTQYSAAITLSITIGLAGPAIATSPESSGAAPPPAESPGLEEIIVTAQRRQEDVKEVPASISVLGGAALENGHIEDLEDITRAVPGNLLSGRRWSWA
jgi:iron complex outermembrane receptor protein